MKPIATRAEISEAADLLGALPGFTELADRLRSLARAVGDTALVYAIPARDTPDGIAYVLSSEPKPEAEYEVLCRSPLRQFMNDTMVAWLSGEISEGRASALLGINRQALRDERMQALGRVNKPIDDEGLLQRRKAAQEAIATYIDLWLEQDDTLDLNYAEERAIRSFWEAMAGNYVFLALVDRWRMLYPPIPGDPQ